jgi:hypothetical protein
MTVPSGPSTSRSSVAAGQMDEVVVTRDMSAGQVLDSSFEEEQEEVIN